MGKYIWSELKSERIAQGALVLRKGEKAALPLEQWAEREFGDLTEPDRKALRAVDGLLSREEQAPFRIGDTIATVSGRRLVVTQLGDSGEISQTRWHELEQPETDTE